jgi:hypothetical protein
VFLGPDMMEIWLLHPLSFERDSAANA